MDRLVPADQRRQLEAGESRRLSDSSMTVATLIDILQRQDPSFDVVCSWERASSDIECENMSIEGNVFYIDVDDYGSYERRKQYEASL